MIRNWYDHNIVCPSVGNAVHCGKRYSTAKVSEQQNKQIGSVPEEDNFTTFNSYSDPKP